MATDRNKKPPQAKDEGPDKYIRLPRELWEELKRSAEENERTISGEAIWGLRRYLAGRKQPPTS